MTEQQAIDLLDQVTRTLPPTAPDLVAGAISRGRRRRRRHLAGTAAATVAVLGLVGGGLTVALSGAAPEGSRGLDPAATSKPQPTTTPSPPAAAARLAVAARDVPATFGSIIRGEITTIPNKELLDDRPIVDFLWDGYAVRVGLTPGAEQTGLPVPEPKRRCEEFGHTDEPCLPGRLPGSYEESLTATGPAVDGGVTVRFLNVYLPNGWDVLVTVANAADTKDAPPLAAEPPLTVDQLRDVAYSDVWFQ